MQVKFLRRPYGVRLYLVIAVVVALHEVHRVMQDGVGSTIYRVLTNSVRWLATHRVH